MVRETIHHHVSETKRNFSGSIVNPIINVSLQVNRIDQDGIAARDDELIAKLNRGIYRCDNKVQASVRADGERVDPLSGERNPHCKDEANEPQSLSEDLGTGNHSKLRGSVRYFIS